MPAITKTLDYRLKRIIVEIDSVDKSDLINFESLEVQNNLYSKADACYFTYEKFGSRTYVPAGGDEIGIWDRGFKIFGGEITNVKVRIAGKVLVYDVECKDWVDQLDGELVTETYENQTVNAIIADLKSKYATTFDITNVACTTVIEAIYFDLKPMSKCLDELAEIAGYHWFVDPSKKIYFFAEGSITSPFNITDTNGKCLTQSLKIEEDYEQLKNRVNILGGSIASVQVHNQASIDAYGEHEIVIRDDSLTSTDEATQKANAVLAAFKDPIKKGSFKTYVAGLISGQKININSTLRGVNQDFVIQSVVFRARTPTDFNYEVQVMTQQGQDLIDLFEQEIMRPPPAARDIFGNKNFTCSIKFTVVNYHKVEWEEGHIIMSSGEDYTIAAGDREFTNAEVWYFRPSVSETTLQFSTTFGDGVGDDRVPLGYAIPNPNTALGAQFIPKGFMGGVRFWGGENIVARTVLAQQIGLESLTSDLVTTGEFITLSAQIKNAIIQSAHIISLNAEKINVGVLTGMTIQSDVSGNNRVLLTPTDDIMFKRASDDSTICGIQPWATGTKIFWAELSLDKQFLYLHNQHTTTTKIFAQLQNDSLGTTLSLIGGGTGASSNNKTLYAEHTGRGIVGYFKGSGESNDSIVKIIGSGSAISLNIVHASTGYMMSAVSTGINLLAYLQRNNAAATGSGVYITSNAIESSGYTLELHSTHTSKTTPTLLVEVAGLGYAAEFNPGSNASRTKAAVAFIGLTGKSANIRLMPIVAAPASPSKGDIYYNASDDHFYGWIGSWKQLDNA